MNQEEHDKLLDNARKEFEQKEELLQEQLNGLTTSNRDSLSNHILNRTTVGGIVNTSPSKAIQWAHSQIHVLHRGTHHLEDQVKMLRNWLIVLSVVSAGLLLALGLITWKELSL